MADAQHCMRRDICEQSCAATRSMTLMKLPWQQQQVYALSPVHGRTWDRAHIQDAAAGRVAEDHVSTGVQASIW